MQLTKLEVKGFKSFGDKITINFNEGVTAIVGPNGCGKSNVVDALRWVLGEQSTRMLRSDKMENIIFNGTNKRKASNLAEVSITFDNTKNILPTEFTTVTVTRKLYRNGDSEYRLNDVKCRLKDITDLFMDTGIGSDSYSIIELKMVDEIINNKDHSRRKLFEEASGISKYKVRKRQTLSKLQNTEEDLERVEDLLYEINKNLKSIERQAKKAERYYEIKKDYKDSSIALAQYNIEQFAQSLEELNSRENEQNNKNSETNSQLAKKEAELQKLKKDTVDKEKNLSVQQKATNEHIHKIRNYESEKKIKNEQLKFLQEKESRLNSELEKDKQQFNHSLYNIKRLHEELHVEAEKAKTMELALAEDKKEVEELRGQQQTAKIKLDAFKNELNSISQHIHQQEKEIAVLSIQKDALEQEAERNDSDTDIKQEEVNQFSRKVEELEAVVENLQNRQDERVAFENDIQSKKNTAEKELKEIELQIQQTQRSLDAKQNEYNLTKSMVDNLEGFPESIRFLRKTSGWKNTNPLVSDVLFCQEEYRVAIESFLEPIMNFYVVDEKEEAFRAIKLLRDSTRGKAGFFVLNDLQKEDKEEPAPHDDLIRAMDVVQVEEKYLPLVQHLLKNVWLSPEKSEKELIRLAEGTQITLLHTDGNYVIRPSSISGGSVGLFEGKRIGRAKNLERLAKEIKKLQSDLDRFTDKKEENEALIKRYAQQSIQAEIEELKAQIQRSTNELIGVKTKHEQYKDFIQSSQNRKADIAQKLKEIREKLQVLGPTLEEQKEKFEKDSKEISLLQENYDLISEELIEISSAFNQANIRLHQQQNKVSGLEKDLEYREVQKETYEKRIEENTQELAGLKEEMKEALQYVDHNDTDLIAMYAEKESLEKGLQDMEDAYFEIRNQTNTLEEEISVLRQNKEKTSFIIQEIKDKKTELQIQLNALKERLSVEFDIDIRDLLDQEKAEHTHSKEELEERCKKLKTRLDTFGEVNPMAKEAYEEINERYNFISKEKEDLIHARTSLLETISEIDHSANEKFMEAFNAVRANFQNVFRSLFSEQDACDLILSQPDDPLESEIEIIAQPKGKRPLSINQLSGGEKTLTATALLFSLYLLKPAPFCVFDEVDAPLDDTNIDKFNNIIREFSKQSQFIVVSHNKRTIASTDIIYGVTMVEQGVSKVVAVDLREVA